MKCRLLVTRPAKSDLRAALIILPPNPGVLAYTNLSLGGGAQYCSSSAGAALGPNNAKTFKARGALAPPICNLPACGP